MNQTHKQSVEIQQTLNRALKVNEIFFSIQGESSLTGLPTTFIRLTGCPLRCQYCDSEYAFYEGKKLRIGEILKQVAEHRTRYVTVTGGEPLAQKACHQLLTLLCDEGYQVSLETSGTMDLSSVDERVIKIMDIKTPGSGEVARNRYENLQFLNQQDEIKFVICNREDYEWAKDLIQQHLLTERCEVLLSTSHEELQARELADWVLADHLPVRMQIQLHKHLWGDVPGK